MAEKVIDLFFKIVSVLSWIAAILILFKHKIQKTAAEKSADREDKKILKNKDSQREQEEGLKEMAQFLCDRCGKSVAVAEGKQNRVTKNGISEIVDVCPECYDYLEKRNAEIARIRAEYEAALERVAQCKKELIALDALEGDETPQKTSDEQQVEEAEAADIKQMLGL